MMLFKSSILMMLLATINAQYYGGGGGGGGVGRSGGGGDGGDQGPQKIRLNLGIAIPPIVLKLPRLQMPQVSIRANFMKKPYAKPLELSLPPPPQIQFGDDGYEDNGYGKQAGGSYGSSGYSSGYGGGGQKYGGASQQINLNKNINIESGNNGYEDGYGKGGNAGGYEGQGGYAKGGHGGGGGGGGGNSYGSGNQEMGYAQQYGGQPQYEQQGGGGGGYGGGYTDQQGYGSAPQGIPYIEANAKGAESITTHQHRHPASLSHEQHKPNKRPHSKQQAIHNEPVAMNNIQVPPPPPPPVMYGMPPFVPPPMSFMPPSQLPQGMSTSPSQQSPQFFPPMYALDPQQFQEFAMNLQRRRSTNEKKN